MTSTDTSTLWQLPDGELAAALVAQERHLARVYARSLALLGEATRRGLAGALGYRDEVRLLTGVLRLSVREAKARLSQAEATQPPAGTSGGQGEPVLPATAEAVAAGEITAEHVREISALFARCPGWVTPGQRATSVRELVALAVQAPPETVRRVAHRLAAYWDQDGTPPGEVERELAEPVRELRYTHLRGGGLRFTGQLDAETGAVLEGLLGPLAKPRPTDVDGAPDPRTTAQRQGDALGEILELAARVDELATQGGNAPWSPSPSAWPSWNTGSAPPWWPPRVSRSPWSNSAAGPAKPGWSPPSSAPAASPSTWAAAPGTPPRPSAAPSPCATGAAPGPDARGHRNGARPITSTRGDTPAPPTSTPWCWSATTTTGNSTTPTGKSASPAASPSSPHQPT